ncbi:YidC/Oxa1 family membrane protein insertase [Halanaerobacter jeridensis]|uniref:YidC/Oxa1 family membrane protein insertase n=1 Tax=Halanaerobacter jeridensis TaxID=706427 RepID=A0A939BT20_9FIRM|nr:membrane protein insertase YidC [Halanaerobacter jeridensis]MBM7557766.1 YidC/Oxa1 family membrane protein insertase [Halanaerobacter jeridensis]
MFRKKLLLVSIVLLALVVTGCSTTAGINVKVQESDDQQTVSVKPQQEEYEEGEKVTLTAFPKEDFKYWSVSDKKESKRIEENPWQIKLDSKDNIKAVYKNGEVAVDLVQDFGFIGNFMQKLLNTLYDFTNSYGLAIILLTAIIRIILFPLISKQTKSMKKMQKIQPMIEELKEKYDDQEKQQEEMMNLYQKYKINPAAGCLPLLVQMPILIALFRALKGWNALQTESFLLIPDLSQPYIPLVILTGLAMFAQSHLQQKFSGGSQGSKAAYFMPLLIVVIGFSFPAGVLLYWLTSNLAMTAQQYIIYQQPDPELEAIDETEDKEKDTASETDETEDSSDSQNSSDEKEES